MWGLYTLLTNLPTYFSTILHFSLKKNGALSAAPYIILAALLPCCGFVADHLRKHRNVSTTHVRKIFHFLGQALPAGFLVAAGYSGCNPTLAVLMLILAVGSSSLAGSGFHVNHIDVSPTHAGVLMGLSNTLGTLGGKTSADLCSS